MRFTVRILGTEVFHISTDPEPPPEPEDRARDLSGGAVGSMPINVAYRPGEEDMGERPEWD